MLAREEAHRLRSPLTVVQGFAAVLAEEDRQLSLDEQRDYAARIKRAAEELADIIDELAPPRPA